MKDEIWVWLPRGQDGRITPVAAELLYEGQGLARRLGVALVAITDRVPDSETRTLLDAWGLGEPRQLSQPAAPHPLYDGGASPLAGLGGEPPRLLLLADDAFGKVAGPLWAAECGVTLVNGATGVTADAQNYVVARPSHGEQFEALVTVPLRSPLAVTLLPGAVGSVAAPPRNLHGQAAMAAQVEQAGQARDQYQIIPPDPANLDIADAERIVAFGRGAFNREAVALVEQLAERLGAVVAGTRPAADEGWLPFERQVGLTGAVVQPKLYVAVGISGAPYHMVGIKDPEQLIAINSDPEAPIFGSAKLGIVGDLYEVLPRLIAELDEGKGLAGNAGAAGEKAKQ
ncbi:MAG: electron transfer flavoprotein subunit alpha/FixB family protein [SAR324 cluster bacterium]|nr:electron transfer flavoprotein subunit alpha/FixB family protein [SAR324 cluster bacterium]